MSKYFGILWAYVFYIYHLFKQLSCAAKVTIFCPTDSKKFPKTSRWQPSVPSESINETAVASSESSQGLNEKKPISQLLLQSLFNAILLKNSDSICYVLDYKKVKVRIK